MSPRCCVVCVMPSCILVDPRPGVALQRLDGSCYRPIHRRHKQVSAACLRLPKPTPSQPQPLPIASAASPNRRSVVTANIYPCPGVDYLFSLFPPAVLRAPAKPRPPPTRDLQGKRGILIEDGDGVA
uniref:Uncharacterized protein n=1 Tax=Oryza sativa subsp. japonica TaxID=39947 RepID=Q6ESR1_ORYSJ|nr:hypothetical protein [Oryza sativa Japonica Group]BAD28309.1 hypothetical protein [Oryza sativa Japonica Group]